MMKYQMHALILQVIDQLQHQQMELPEYIMYSQVHAYHYCKVMKMKYLRLHLIHKEIKLSQLVVIKHVEYGALIMGMKYKCLKVMKMKYSLVHLIMKEILLLLDLKIILVEYGKIKMLLKQLWPRLEVCDTTIRITNNGNNKSYY